MTTPFLPGLAKVQAQYKDSEGRVDECVFYVVSTQTPQAPFTTAQLTAVQGHVDNRFQSWTPEMPTTCSYIGSIVTDQQNNTGFQVNNIGFTPVAGQVAGGQAPRQVAALLSIHGARRYRGGHSRLYFPQLSASQIGTDGQTLNSTAVTTIKAIWTNLVADLTAMSPAWEWVILHSRMQVVPHTIPPTFVAPFFEGTFSATGQTIIATQRRRLRKVAHH